MCDAENTDKLVKIIKYIQISYRQLIIHYFKQKKHPPI